MCLAGLDGPLGNCLADIIHFKTRATRKILCGEKCIRSHGKLQYLTTLMPRHCYSKKHFCTFVAWNNVAGRSSAQTLALHAYMAIALLWIEGRFERLAWSNCLITIFCGFCNSDSFAGALAHVLVGSWEWPPPSTCSPDSIRIFNICTQSYWHTGAHRRDLRRVRSVCSAIACVTWMWVLPSVSVSHLRTDCWLDECVFVHAYMCVFLVTLCREFIKMSKKSTVFMWVLGVCTVYAYCFCAC